MKHLLKTTVVLSATNVFLVTGGLIAFADWSTDSVPGAISATVLAVPRAGRPSVLPRAGVVRLWWQPSFIRPGAPVTGYLVTRTSTGGDTHPVCRVSQPSCDDVGLTPGAWSYAVRAIQGNRWLGALSPNSATVIMDPGPTGPTGTAVGAPTAGAPAVSPGLPVVGGASAIPPIRVVPPSDHQVPQKRPRIDPVPAEPLPPAPTPTTVDPGPSPDPNPVPIPTDPADPVVIGPQPGDAADTLVNLAP
ncbi:MAG TPA: hypothetical protein VF755_12555 [Catenuloplanes sp.]|jgi:hypothetical protein